MYFHVYFPYTFVEHIVVLHISKNHVYSTPVMVVKLTQTEENNKIHVSTEDKTWQFSSKLYTSIAVDATGEFVRVYNAARTCTCTFT